MPPATITLQDFYQFSKEQRQQVLLSEIKSKHTFHFHRNTAYRKSVTAKKVGEQVEEKDLVKILRPTSQVFKSYIDILGTPFPHHKPAEFIQWLKNNLSIDLPNPEFEIKARYRSLEEFLTNIEQAYSHLGLEIGTSSGTTGRATIMVHDARSAEQAAEAYQHAVYRLWGTFDQHQFIFVMPSETRIVMARIARTATARLGLDAQSHFTIPFSATPDQVRVRSGRLFEPGRKGVIEQRILHPFMAWMNENYVKAKYVNQTIDTLERYSNSGANILLFGGYVQLHHLYQGLRDRGLDPERNTLTFGNQSIIGTGGGMKEQYPFTPAQIIQDVQKFLRLEKGDIMPHRDVYGMAEANWAAAQCSEGNYHLPPWVYAVVINEDDQIIDQPQATGLLAFYDPITDLGLYPHFFKTADRVTLVSSGSSTLVDRTCACGIQTDYLLKNSISRQDRLDEAGCAGQI